MCNFAFRILKYMEERTDNGYSHVLKYTSLFGGVQGFIILIGLVRNWAMARLLGAGGLGLNSLLTSMQNFASQCTNFGISFGAVPRLSEFHEQQETQKLLYYIQVTRLWSLIAAALGFLFCVAISPLINGLSFTWGNHTYHYAMLAIAVATSAIAGGEVVVLKATRRLGALAKIQIYNVLISVVVSIPLYYFFYHSGVVPAIVLIAATNMLLTIAYSYRCYPLRLNFNRSMLRDGADMIRLGLAYVLAAAIGSATEMLIRSYLNVEGNLDDVGEFCAAVEREQQGVVVGKFADFGLDAAAFLPCLETGRVIGSGVSAAGNGAVQHTPDGEGLVCFNGIINGEGCDGQQSDCQCEHQSKQFSHVYRSSFIKILAAEPFVVVSGPMIITNILTADMRHGNTENRWMLIKNHFSENKTNYNLSNLKLGTQNNAPENMSDLAEK